MAGKQRGKTLSIIESGTEQARRGAVQGAPPAFSERVCQSAAAILSNVVPIGQSGLFWDSRPRQCGEIAPAGSMLGVYPRPRNGHPAHPSNPTQSTPEVTFGGA